MIESLFEKQQNPVPGPLDAEFHVLLLAAGEPGFMDPQTILEKSCELPTENHRAMALGFYTDIPPRLSGTAEEIAHTIEVAVRRSFDFMKCPVIFGGDSSIVPAIIRGVEGQVKQFSVVPVAQIESSVSNSMVIQIDGDSLNRTPDFSSVDLTISQVKAIVITGTSAADPVCVVDTVLNLCDRIRC